MIILIIKAFAALQHVSMATAVLPLLESLLGRGRQLRLGVGDSAAIDDAVQTVGEKLLRSGARPDAPYITTMVRNATIDDLRAETTRRAYESSFAQHAGALVGVGPEESLYGEQALEALYRALDELTALNREIFIRAYIDGEPRAQIARILGLKLSTIEKRLAQAKRHCLKRLTPYLDDF